ncbi:Polycomb group protein EMBRYONIC FLOWER 2 [Glycine soja]|uniref:Polycomb group protein EMBRYONIC FLOWER 2 n=1 Tax=Glycine soja TaxID=3848 RepID=A0A0B2R780_GLYSO|nr:Polycomb group protein EMBRYONIC FLOWER 2 [Glycine soja]
MPGIPVAARATSSHPDACEHLSAEEELAAEESLSIYCKPVELYNILQRRAMRNPSFLQRCLHYRIKAKHKKRIQMAVSLTRTITESQNVFPMSICLARRISDHGASRSTSKQVQITISAEEFGAKEKSPYLSYAGGEVPSSSLSHIIGYYNNKLQRTEVTKDFTCPFCLVKCACFKGLRCHLSSSHDLFNFEFWVSDECHAVNVSVKNDISRSEIVSDDVDPRVQTFFFCGKPLKRSTSKDQSSKNAVGLESSFPAGETDMLEKDDGISATIIRSHPDRDSVPSMSDCDQAVLQFAKTRKLSIERPDPRNSTLLRKRQFFHSHKAQPMAIEQVVSDKDSEDEVDDDVADFEDRRMLENFVDVSKDEKSLMHMWNSFVRKHRVIADGHISWACEAFSKLHAPEFVQSPSLAGCWRIFMVKLYNHGLLDARTMNDCNIILEQYQRQNSDPKR